jgi:hypothetical protein
MADLESLSSLHGTNKIWHGYMSFYEKLFSPIKDNITKFLEIGIDQGNSLIVWREYFKNATIYGIDLVIPEKIKKYDRLIWGVADQSNANELKSLQDSWGNPIFDCILDDGGHTVKQQRVSIETLWSSLKPGGYYIIEDLHTNIRSLHFIHPHLNSNSPHIDENPTIHDKILNIMAGSTTEFTFPITDIEEIYYFNTPNKLSLSCAIKKSQ